MSPENILLSKRQALRAMVLIPAAFAVESLIPPVKVSAEGGMTIEEGFPPPSQLKIFPIPDWLTKEQYDHLDFKNNWDKIARISHQFDIDHRVLVAILLTESGNKIENGKGDGQGPFQICLPTKNELEQKYVSTNQKYQDILKKCGGDISNRLIYDFPYPAFLACVYLDKAGVPKGEASFDESYLDKVKDSAIKYNQGLYARHLSSYGKIYGNRVIKYLSLLLTPDSQEKQTIPANSSPGILTKES